MLRRADREVVGSSSVCSSDNRQVPVGRTVSVFSASVQSEFMTTVQEVPAVADDNTDDDQGSDAPPTGDQPGEAAGSVTVVPPTTEALLQQLSINDEGASVDDVSAEIAAHGADTIVCDLGYGVPKEARPRREKILAVSKQLVNFLEWQRSSVRERRRRRRRNCCAALVVVGWRTDNDGDDSIKEQMLERMRQLWKNDTVDKTAATTDNDNGPFPDDRIFFSELSLQSFVQRYRQQKHQHYGSYSDDDGGGGDDDRDIVYLSPDSSEVLDVTRRPPAVVIVGLLIDRRRIQTNRSLERAERHRISTARWPLELVSDVLDANEPLNVDTVLEGMQHWYWNCDDLTTDNRNVNDDDFYSSSGDGGSNKNDGMRGWTTTDNAASPTPASFRECFEDAARQALMRHQKRHPGRPQHKVSYECK